MNYANVVQQRQNRDEKIETAHAALADAVARLQTGDSWRDMLAKVARGGRHSLRRLSFRNQILIAIQSPDATCVATYGAWLKVGRQVRKGEKAITILAPVIVSKTKEDSDEAVSVLVGFRPHPVFSGEQTEAAPGGRGQLLPEPARITKDLAMPEAFEHTQASKPLGT